MKRIHIARLEVDLRGVPPATARAAAQGLAAAMHESLREGAVEATPAATLNAGAVHTTRDVSAAALSRQLARQLAATLRRR